MEHVENTVGRAHNRPHENRGTVTRYQGPTAAGFVILLVLVTLVGVASTEHGLALARGLPDWLAGLGLIGVIAMAAAAWIVSAQWPAVAVGLAVAALGLLVPVWATWDWLPPWVQPALLAAAPLGLAGVAQTGLRWRRGDRRSGHLGIVYLLAGAGVIVQLVAYNPFAEPGCTLSCVRADPIAKDLLSTHSAVAITAVLMAAAGLIGIVTLVRRAHRVPTAIVRGVVAALALLASGWAVRWARWDEPLPDVMLVLPYPVSAVIIGSSVLAGSLAVRRTRAIADRLVARLGDPEVAVRDLGDGVRDVEFAVAGEGRWVDRAGRPVPVTRDEDSLLLLSDETGPVLRLLLAPNARRADLLEDVSPATRLALQNAQLAAVVRARLADVQASRRRIVAASDAERQRIERDLHDGAQQRLVSASLHLSLASRGLTADEIELSHAKNLIHDALEHLRQLAHGIFPGTLLTEGLRAALEELVRASDVPSTVEIPDIDVGEATATAAYAMVAAILANAQRAGATSARIAGSLHDQRLIVTTEVLGRHGLDRWDSADVADRIGAIGGQMTSEPGESRMLVRAELPCVSS